MTGHALKVMHGVIGLLEGCVGVAAPFGSFGDSYVAQAPVCGAGDVESGDHDSGVGDFDHARAG